MTIKNINIVKKLVVGQLQTNCYILVGNNNESFIIDPGDDAGFIINTIKDFNLKPKAILATHGHFDHVLGALELKLAFNIPLYMSKKDLNILKRAKTTALFFLGIKTDPPAEINGSLENNQILKLGNLKLQVIDTPGHTQGGICFYLKKQNICFVGDLIFKHGSFGRTDLEGGDLEMLNKSIKKILRLPSKTILYPGHGEKTKISEEKKYYPELLKE